MSDEVLNISSQINLRWLLCIHGYNSSPDLKLRLRIIAKSAKLGKSIERLLPMYDQYDRKT